jgi:hypothetical protein
MPRACLSLRAGNQSHPKGLFGSLLCLACMGSSTQAAASQAMATQTPGVWCACSEAPGSHPSAVVWLPVFSFTAALTISQSSHEARVPEPAGARLPRNEDQIRFLGCSLGGAFCIQLATLCRSPSQPIAPILHRTSQGHRKAANQTRPSSSRYSTTMARTCDFCCRRSSHFLQSTKIDRAILR